jgi:hypothetical protein
VLLDEEKGVSLTSESLKKKTNTIPSVCAFEKEITLGGVPDSRFGIMFWRN